MISEIISQLSGRGGMGLNPTRKKAASSVTEFMNGTWPTVDLSSVCQSISVWWNWSPCDREGGEKYQVRHGGVLSFMSILWCLYDKFDVTKCFLCVIHWTCVGSLFNIEVLSTLIISINSFKTCASTMLSFPLSHNANVVGSHIVTTNSLLLVYRR